MKILKFVKENPKSLLFIVAVIITVGQVLFPLNPTLVLAGTLFTAITGLNVQNFLQGPIDKITLEVGDPIAFKEVIEEEVEENGGC